MSEQPKPGGDVSPQDILPQAVPRWEELRERVGDSLTAAREILKDSGSVVAWSRALRAESAALRSEARALHGRGRETGVEAQSVEAQSGERAVVVRMLLPLDLFTSAPLSQVFLSLTAPSAEDSGESGRVVAVDLRAAQNMDAAGLRTLADGRKALRDAGRRLVVLVLPGSQPARVLEAAGLCRFLPCLGSLDEMLDEMLGPEPAEAGGR